jgi:hypothetical protein
VYKCNKSNQPIQTPANSHTPYNLSPPEYDTTSNNWKCRQINPMQQGLSWLSNRHSDTLGIYIRLLKLYSQEPTSSRYWENTEHSILRTSTEWHVCPLTQLVYNYMQCLIPCGHAHTGQYWKLNPRFLKLVTPQPPKIWNTFMLVNLFRSAKSAVLCNVAGSCQAVRWK